MTIQRGASTKRMNLEMEPTWFPNSHPAWPVDAETPTELLVCLILSLTAAVIAEMLGSGTTRGLGSRASISPASSRAASIENCALVSWAPER